MSKWFVYILECADKSLYTGITNNVDLRLDKHLSDKGAKYTKSRKVKRLAYQEECENRSKALKREIEIKSWPRKKKLKLITKSL